MDARTTNARNDLREFVERLDRNGGVAVVTRDLESGLT